MKFLYHHRTQAEDGQAVHIRALQRALVAAGHRVEEVGLVAQGARDAGALARERSRWAWVSRLPRFARELAEYAYAAPARRRLVATGRAFGPDVLYERYAFGNTAGVSAARQLGVPLLLEVNSPMVPELSATRGLAFPRLARRVEDWILREADRVLAVTGVLRDMLIGYGASPERVAVVPNGVDLDLYPTPGDAAARADALERLALVPDGAFTIGFVGYYRAWHRLDLAVDALADPALADARLVLVGDGPARAELEERARARGVASRVVFAGRFAHDHVPRLLAAFDVAIVPAINPYASPLKLQEYMAAGLPTIAPDQPNLREVLEDGRTARLAPPGDAAAFAHALVELARDPEAARAMGRAARAHVVAADLTWRGNARRVADHARAAIAEAKAR